LENPRIFYKPLRKLIIPRSIENSKFTQIDNIRVFGSPVSKKYLLVVMNFNLGRLDLIRLSVKAVDSIFAGEG
jgi:hypothetical protein